jgi:hypothetical protein
MVFIRPLSTADPNSIDDRNVAADVGDGVGEGNALGADFDAVLREAALLNAAVAGQGAQALFLEDLAGGVVVEELDLGDGGRADEAGVVVELRADFHAAAAGDAIRERVVGFLLLREDARAGAQIVGAVDGDPGFDALRFSKRTERSTWRSRTSGNFESGSTLDGLLEIVDQRRAGHAGFAVDAHRAGAADFLEAIGVVGDGRGGRPSAVTGLAAISIMAEMTFMPGRQGSSNRSHTAGASGLAWRLISSCTVLVAMMLFDPSGAKKPLFNPVCLLYGLARTLAKIAARTRVRAFPP